MLHATEHALKHVLNATKDNKDIKAATTNAAARADSGINVIAATETNLDTWLTGLAIPKYKTMVGFSY